MTVEIEQPIRRRTTVVQNTPEEITALVSLGRIDTAQMAAEKMQRWLGLKRPQLLSGEKVQYLRQLVDAILYDIRDGCAWQYYARTQSTVRREELLRADGKSQTLGETMDRANTALEQARLRLDRAARNLREAVGRYTELYNSHEGER